MLVEPDAELAALHRLLAGAHSDGGRVVLVRGHAGMGKTALISRFVEEVRDTARVLVGSCDDLTTTETLGPFKDIIEVESRDWDSLPGGSTGRVEARDEHSALGVALDAAFAGPATRP